MYPSTRSYKRPLGFAAIACVAALASVVALTGAAQASTPACATSGLVVWLDTMGNGAAGTTYYNLEFTNLSGHACKLVGYPGVSGIGLSGRQLGSAASRDGAHAPATVTLASGTTVNMVGTTATVILAITDVANFPAASCHPVTAAGLRVFPPNQRASKLIPFPFRACSSGPSYLHVEAVQKGILPG